MRFSNTKLMPHSQSAYHMKRSDQQKWDVSHRLLVIGWEAIKLVVKKIHKTYNLFNGSWDGEVVGKEKSSVTHLLLVMGWDMIDETAWQRNKAVSLTACWPWDETWLIRLPSKEIKQCHSLPVGHGMRHDWWDCQAGKEIKQCHSHPVGQGMRHDWWDCQAKK